MLLREVCGELYEDWEPAVLIELQRIDIRCFRFLVAALGFSACEI